MCLVNQMHHNVFLRQKVQDLISLRNICAASLMTSIDHTFQATLSAYRSAKKNIKDSPFCVDGQNLIPSPSFCIRNDFTWNLHIWLGWIISMTLSQIFLNVKPVPLRRAGVSDATTLSNAWWFPMLSLWFHNYYSYYWSY